MLSLRVVGFVGTALTVGAAMCTVTTPVMRGDVPHLRSQFGVVMIAVNAPDVSGDKKRSRSNMWEAMCVVP